MQMQKTIGMLAVLLAAQLVLAVGMSYTGPSLAMHRPDTPLIDLGDRTVDRITIAAPDDQRVVLAQEGDGWVLPGTGDFPADKSRVDRLLGELKGLKRGLAVATTKGAQKRFKVSNDDFERRVQLARGDEMLATLYFGTSPGMRRVNARTSEDDAVYTTEFGVYDAPVKPEDWEDKGVLKIPPGEIDSIGLTGLTLERRPAAPAGTAAGDKDLQKPETRIWSSEGLADGEAVNQANADALAQQLAGLTTGAVLGTEANPDYGLDQPALAIQVQRQGGQTIEYRLGKRDKADDYVLKASSRPEYFRLPGYTADALVKAAARDQLVAVAGEATEEGEAAQQGAAQSTPAQGTEVTDHGKSAAGAS
jgi:hypothetical protein